MHRVQLDNFFELYCYLEELKNKTTEYLKIEINYTNLTFESERNWMAFGEKYIRISKYSDQMTGYLL